MSDLNKMQKDVIVAIYEGLHVKWASTQLEFKDGHKSPVYFLWHYRRQFLKGKYSPASITRCIRWLTGRGLVEWLDRSKYSITLTEEGRKICKSLLSSNINRFQDLG